MDASVPFPTPRGDSCVPFVAPGAADPARLLAVTATYLLSEAGRKASLLAGGDGRAEQRQLLQVPISRLHLVTVDPDGQARLTLRPRFELGPDQRIRRVTTPPTFDAPPTPDDLLRDAARQHELARVWQTQQTGEQTTRRHTTRERRLQAAQAFLADPTQRAVVHPPPTPGTCILTTPAGTMRFDADRGEGVERQVPLEAHRRFRADLRVRREQGLKARAAQLAVHEEKKRLVAEWVAAHGTPEQQARHAAGVLPMSEAIGGMTDQAFAALGDWPRYQRDGAARLQAHLRQFPQYSEAVVSALDLEVTSKTAVTATAEQWAAVQRIQALVPDATVTLREHRLRWKRDSAAPTLTVVGVLVVARSGSLTLRREFAVGDS